MVALRGPRRVGKTTIQEQLIDQLLNIEHVPASRIFRIQFDEAPSLGEFKRPVIVLVQWFEDHVLKESLNALANRGEPVYLFFDEVQYLPNWAAQLKALPRPTRALPRVFITGSSALRIGAGQSSLTGRASVLELGTLRLNEIAAVRGFGELPPFQPDARLEEWTRKDFWLELLVYAKKHAKVLKKAFESFSDVGGYPMCHQPGVDRSQLGGQIVEDVVRRTVRLDRRAGQGGKRQRPQIIEETYRQVCRYAGQHVSRREPHP